MFFVDTIELKGLGNRSYLAGGEHTAVAWTRRVTSTRYLPLPLGAVCGSRMWRRPTSTTTT